MLVDLHTHSLFSDGALTPAESVRRAKAAGYSGIAITDHADSSNLAHIIPAVLRFKNEYNPYDDDFKVLIGVELTHVRPFQIRELADRARGLGADIVVVHGETIVEPVEEGTNRAAILAGVDILAHPGLISLEDALLAAEKGVYLEITTRKGHAYTNAHVAKTAFESGAKLVINNDFHAPGEYAGEELSIKILLGAAISLNGAQEALSNTVHLFNKKLK
ncbi:MAG: histidinol phosphate phosphatase domain-containing protein [Deferribacteraceae bacterium]|jgi:histidinol phosphatase-like PHP family hydrolase|nr:histidinol phosphate phosphatase domain-containing protein [Deferribacteraceae bacterium]